MDDVARHLGISKKTLYQFVSNKMDLVLKVASLHLEKEMEAISQIQESAANPVEEHLKIARYVTGILRQTNPAVVYDLQKYYKEAWDKFQSLHRGHVYDVIKSNLETGKRDGFYREEIDPEIIAKFYVGKSEVLVDEDFFPLDRYKRDELFLEFISYHLHGVVLPKGLAVMEAYLKETSNQ